GPDGKLYVAAGDEGLYRRDDDNWTQLLTEQANFLAFAADGLLYIANDEGVSTYDGTNLTPGDPTGLPANFRVNDMQFTTAGTLYVLVPGSLFSYAPDTGFAPRAEVTAPLFIAPHPDGKMYVVDNFGQVGYYEGEDFTNRAITGVFSTIGLADFAINTDGVFWGAQQGVRPGVVRYDGTLANEPISPGDLVDGAILINYLTVGSGGRVFVGSDLRPGVAIIDDPTTPVSSAVEVALPLGVVPNPVQRLTQVRLTAPVSGPATLRLLDAGGRTVITESLRLQKGDFTHELDLSGLATGAYFVEITLGGKRAVGRLHKF
ncbi:MAG: T9SS type A sorting domain-containing protein, partial [Bacteroidota bacterium]